MATLDTGSLVRTRGREWVVLPESTGEVLMLRPLGGLDEEIIPPQRLQAGLERLGREAGGIRKIDDLAQHGSQRRSSQKKGGGRERLLQENGHGRAGATSVGVKPAMLPSGQTRAGLKPALGESERPLRVTVAQPWRNARCS